MSFLNIPVHYIPVWHMGEHVDTLCNKHEYVHGTQEWNKVTCVECISLKESELRRQLYVKKLKEEEKRVR